MTEHDSRRTTKYLELPLDSGYLRRVPDALQKLQAMAEERGVPAGTKPTVLVKEIPEGRYKGVITYRWEWE